MFVQVCALVYVLLPGAFNVSAKAVKLHQEALTQRQERQNEKAQGKKGPST